MANIGEELVGAYLRMCLNCDFVDYNVYTRDEQGEIDVIGINFLKKTIYLCEVATHPFTGLQYNKNGKPANIERLIKKFDKDIRYGKKYYKGFKQHYMFWSPVVKVPKGSGTIHSQMRDVENIRQYIKKRHSVDLQLIINETYLNALNELRARANIETKESKFSVVRLFQIEGRVNKYVQVLKKRMK